jgi:hypothetical protein
MSPKGGQPAALFFVESVTATARIIYGADRENREYESSW